MPKRPAAPPCYECRKERADLDYAPFCSIECAAKHGRCTTEEHSYCRSCDEWSTWSHETGSHDHETVDTTPDGSRWRINRVPS
jgi:hypothetical protein